MKKMYRRILSMLMVAVMLLPITTVAVNATEEGVTHACLDLDRDFLCDRCFSV